VNLVILSKFPSAALDKLAIPFVMGALTTTLNEEQLALDVHLCSPAPSTQERLTFESMRADAVGAKSVPASAEQHS
jgi:hypothetical protein